MCESEDGHRKIHEGKISTSVLESLRKQQAADLLTRGTSRKDLRKCDLNSWKNSFARILFFFFMFFDFYFPSMKNVRKKQENIFSPDIFFFHFTFFRHSFTKRNKRSP